MGKIIQGALFILLLVLLNAPPSLTEEARVCYYIDLFYPDLCKESSLNVTCGQNQHLDIQSVNYSDSNYCKFGSRCCCIITQDNDSMTRLVHSHCQGMEWCDLTFINTGTTVIKYECKADEDNDTPQSNILTIIAASMASFLSFLLLISVILFCLVVKRGGRIRGICNCLRSGGLFWFRSRDPTVSTEGRGQDLRNPSSCRTDRTHPEIPAVGQAPSAYELEIRQPDGALPAVQDQSGQQATERASYYINQAYDYACADDVLSDIYEFSDSTMFNDAALLNDENDTSRREVLDADHVKPCTVNATRRSEILAADAALPCTIDAEHRSEILAADTTSHVYSSTLRRQRDGYDTIPSNRTIVP